MIIDGLKEFFSTFIHIVASNLISLISLNSSISSINYTSRNLLSHYEFNL